ncbi:glycoside hydrolase family 28 protein [Clostridium hydrogenum]|uniref:glycoside hydrolase family 28 protein n=1 Tax=Clostridium hydrogenum TaxID=2855764 RepID=UPI001F3B0856|nr:glycoside hydrolase family 28 protein [Clostridium hydrogenum]
MKKKHLKIYITALFVIIVLAFGVSFFVRNKKVYGSSDEAKKYTYDLPFKHYEIKETKFKNKDFNIKNYGAVEGNNVKQNTEAFKEAIEACTKNGGGRVVVPSGKFITGPIELKSNVNLYLENGSTIEFSTNHADYPIIKDEGSSKYVVASPIYGYKLNNVAITGNGTINGRGDTWRPVKKEKVTTEMWNSLVKGGGVVSGDVWWPSKEAEDGEAYLKEHKNKLTIDDYNYLKDYLRPYMIYLKNCSSILIDGPTIENSPNLCTNITGAKDVIIRNTKVYNELYAQNGDGIDISSSSNVLIYKCNVSAGDDDIALKSSKNKNEKFALQNVVIADCTVNWGHGGFVVGSNTDGGMENVYVHNCIYNGTDAGIKFKSAIGEGGTVKNIYVDGIKMKDIKTDAISLDSFYENNALGENNISNSQKDLIPIFEDIHISNITCNGALNAVYMKALPNAPYTNLYFNNVEINSDKGFEAENTRNIKLTNVKIVPKNKDIYTLTKGLNYEFKNVLCPKNTNIFVKLYGTAKDQIKLVDTNTSSAKEGIKVEN